MLFFPGSCTASLPYVTTCILAHKQWELKTLTGKEGGGGGGGGGVQPPQCLHSSMRLRNEMELQYPDNTKDSSGKQLWLFQI